MNGLGVHDLAKSFGTVKALDGLTFEVADGAFFTIVGPTNAGKSTLLKTIAGLHRQDRGSIAIKGRRANGKAPKDRRVSLLFQNIALFPTLTGFENIAFPLRAAGETAAEIERKVRDAARLLSIEHVLDRLPRTFSGGEQQRVAIGRALVQSADLLMLDEPLTNLDARIRIHLRIAFKRLHREIGRTTLYVTHDQVEAMSLSDRIGVLNEGRFEQIGTPDDIYHRPATRFVARFIGTPPMNLIDADVVEEGGEIGVAGGGFRIALPEARRLACYPKIPRKISLGVRPEEIAVAPASSAATPFQAEVVWVERLGARSIVDVRLGDTIVKAVVRPDHPVEAGRSAWLGFVPRPEHLLDPAVDRFLR